MKQSISIRKKIYHLQTGQALVTLLFFMIISIMITSAAVVLIIVNGKAITRLAQGTRAYYVAESGIENALLQVLRNPGYTSETLPVEDGVAYITVQASGSNYVITSEGVVGNYRRKIQVTYYLDIGSGSDIGSWEEI